MPACTDQPPTSRDGHLTGSALCAALGPRQARRPQARAVFPAGGYLIDAASPREQVEWGQRYEHGEGVAKSPYRAASAVLRRPPRRATPWRPTKLAGSMRTGGACRATTRSRGLVPAAAARATHTRGACSTGCRGQKGSSRLPAAAATAVPARCRLASLFPRYRRPSARRSGDGARHGAGFGLVPMLVLAVIAPESAFDKTAVSPRARRG